MNITKKETGLFTEIDRYLFGEGTHYQIYKKLGSHPVQYENEQGYYFALWAPHAKAVSVVGDFNSWNIHMHPMNLLGSSGIYELFIPNLVSNQLYKFLITTETGELLYKADPYAFMAEYRPATASITTDLTTYQWNDGSWLKKRKMSDLNTSPMSIYEVHLGSWKRNSSMVMEGYYSYRQAAHELAEYIIEMGYTHIELMGIAEYPYDGSWGYQVTGYYAPTSRYGTPCEFKYFVDYMHQQGIGIILDWVPAHFPKDAHGLVTFDGQSLYEYSDPQKGEHPDWGTKIFDYAKNEVSNFLIANALFWIKEYHIDGLRVDAVASMLYLDYGKSAGQWVPNKYGGNQNLEAIEFFRHLNSIIRQQGEGAIMIAEESTAWPQVTNIAENGGLGFHFKWNMGWMNDFLEYLRLDPDSKKFNHHKMTFSMTYFTSEQFILVLSHDEVVHLKCSMLEKMPGSYEEKFANLKVAYTFMFGHPGKKLLFMGQDFGQPHEWDESVSLDWYLTNQPEHKKLQSYVKDLLYLYKTHPALYTNDFSWSGFEWINANDTERSIFSFIRHDLSGNKHLLFICNFASTAIESYRVAVPTPGKYQLLLDQHHGMYQHESIKLYVAEKSSCAQYDYSFSYSLAAYGTAIFSFDDSLS